MKYNIFCTTAIFLMLFPLIFRFTVSDFKERWDYKYIAKPLAWGSMYALIFFEMQGARELASASWMLLPQAIIVAAVGHYFIVFFMKAFEIFGMGFAEKGTADQHRRGQGMHHAADVKKMVKSRKEASRFAWGGVPVPQRLEDRSFLLAGSPGSGKSQAICAALDSIRASGDRAIITDPSAQFLRRYKRDDSLILNPLDSRSQAWSPFAEFDENTYKLDARTIAASLVPTGEGSAEEWNGFVRSFLRDILVKCWETGNTTNSDLNFYSCLASIDELREFLVGTPSLANLLGEGGDKLLGSVRTTGDKFLDPISLLDPSAGKNSFSVKNWTLNGTGWLFVTYQQNRRAALTPIIGAQLNVFADAMLTRTISRDRASAQRVWGVFDEFPLLGKISSIESLLSNGSKHGFAGLVGIQTISQLRATYGRETAQTILACLGTWLVLRCNDSETAQYMSAHAGKEEVLRTNESTGNSDGKHSANKSLQVAIQDVLLPSELQNLPDLQGFLNLAGDYPICPILLALVSDVADQCVDFQQRAGGYTPAQPIPVAAQPGGGIVVEKVSAMELI